MKTLVNHLSPAPARAPIHHAQLMDLPDELLLRIGQLCVNRQVQKLEDIYDNIQQASTLFKINQRLWQLYQTEFTPSYFYLRFLIDNFQKFHQLMLKNIQHSANYLSNPLFEFYSHISLKTAAFLPPMLLSAAGILAGVYSYEKFGENILSYLIGVLVPAFTLTSGTILRYFAAMQATEGLEMDNVTHIILSWSIFDFKYYTFCRDENKLAKHDLPLDYKDYFSPRFITNAKSINGLSEKIQKCTQYNHDNAHTNANQDSDSKKIEQFKCRFFKHLRDYKQQGAARKLHYAPLAVGEQRLKYP